MSEARFISEITIVRLIGDYFTGHCSSCHSDEDEGYSAFIEIDLGRGRYAEVCCKVAQDFDRWLCKQCLDEFGKE